MAHTQMRLSRRMIALALTIVMMVAAATSVFARGVFSRGTLESVERDLGSFQSLQISSGSVDIEVSQARGGARLEAMLDSRREVTVNERGGAVEIEIGRIRGVTSFTRNEVVRLYLPADVEVRLESGSGDVSVQDIRLEELRIDVGSGTIEVGQTPAIMTLDTGSGDIEITDSDGAKDLSTGSGDITVSGSAGDVRAKSASGSQSFDSIRGNIETSSGSGTIRLDDIEGILRISASSGDLRGDSIQLTGSSTFTTGSGGISMSLRNAYDALSFDLDAGSGDIRVGDMRGADRVVLGTGSIEIHARSGSGDQDFRTR